MRCQSNSERSYYRFCTLNLKRVAGVELCSLHSFSPNVDGEATYCSPIFVFRWAIYQSWKRVESFECVRTLCVCFSSNGFNGFALKCGPNALHFLGCSPKSSDLLHSTFVWLSQETFMSRKTFQVYLSNKSFARSLLSAYFHLSFFLSFLLSVFFLCSAFSCRLPSEFIAKNLRVVRRERMDGGGPKMKCW